MVISLLFYLQKSIYKETDEAKVGILEVEWLFYLGASCYHINFR